MENIVNAITKHLIDKKTISKENEKIYAYGFKLIISDIINFCLIILFSVVLGKVLSGIIFLITLCCVRKHSGGFHAKTFFWCRTAMIFTFAIVIGISILIEKYVYSIILITTINIVALIMIGVLSPIEHPNKKLTIIQKQKNKQKAIICTILCIIASTLLCCYNYMEGIVISTTLMAIVMLMIIGIFKLKGGEKNV